MQSKLIFPRSIRYLLAVAEHQSFTRAADSLYISQPTLSQQIKQLEEALGVQLLDRSGRAVRLTDAGEIYSRHAHRALVELDAGMRAVIELEDLSRGFLRLGMTPITSYLATSLMVDFSARYPGIIMSAMEMFQDHIEVGVGENNIDVGIVFANKPSSENWSSKIEANTLYTEPLSLVVGLTHTLAGHAEPLDALAWKQEPLVLLNTNFELRRQFDLYCLEHDIKPNIVIETNSLSMIVQSVGISKLATVLPTTIARSQSNFCFFPLLPNLPHHTIAVIYSKGSYMSPACRAFISMAIKWGLNR